MSDSKCSSLRPTAPSFTKRYSRSSLVQPLHTNIPALFSHRVEPEPQYLPVDWAPYVHPEGQLYFYCDAPLKVVTEEHLYRNDVMEQISHWTTVVADTIHRLQIPLSVNVELYLALDEEDSSSCLYYLIDHSNQAIFWLEPVPTSLLDISPVVSASHLKLALEELYWNHVEYFPSHVQWQRSQVVNDLISVFTHAQADCMTSDYSTFPYTSEQSERFLKLLRPYEDKPVDNRILCFVARLWGVVVSHRFSTHYGQEHCRLSRDQTILPASEYRNLWFFSLMSRLLFAFPDNCVGKLEGIWVDEIVYSEQWRIFMKSCQEDRKLFGAWAFGSMIINLVTLSFWLGSRSLAFFAVILAYTSMALSIIMYIKEQHLAKASAAEAAVYIQAVKHDKYGFQPIALLYSLPKALLVWSVLLFMPQAPMIAVQLLGLVTGGAVTLAFAFVMLTLYCTISPITRPSLLRKSEDDKCSSDVVV